MKTDQPIRQRLVLLTSSLDDEGAEGALRRALSGGDVASVLIDPAGRPEAAFQALAEKLVPIAQEAGAAAIVIDDTRTAGRVRADGIHLTAGDIDAFAEMIAAQSERMIVGGSGFETRHEALEAGEAMPDYILFGRLGQDGHETLHPKTLAMSEWWAEMVEIPCIAMGSRVPGGVAELAGTNAEFIALGAAIFAEPGNEDEGVRQANAVLAERYDARLAAFKAGAKA